MRSRSALTAALAAAQAEMDLITARLRQEHPQEYPPNGGLTFSIVPLLEQVVGNVRATLAVLLASVGILLNIAGDHGRATRAQVPDRSRRNSRTRAAGDRSRRGASRPRSRRDVRRVAGSR